MELNQMLGLKVIIVLVAIYNACKTFSINLLVGWTFD